MKQTCLFLFIGFFCLAFPSTGSPEGSVISLKDFLNEVRSKNLDLKIEAEKTSAKNANSSGLAIPPPMVGVLQLKEENGPSASGFEISQNLPFPTKISNDASARKFEALAQVEMSAARENEIFATAKLLYISLWTAQKKIEYLKEKRRSLEDHIKISRSTARSDSFASIHLIKAESDLDVLENEILAAEQNLRAVQSEIAQMMNQDPDNSLPVATEPPLSEIPRLEPQEAAPQLKSAQLSLEGLKSRESEAKAGWLPDLALRYKQMDATTMTPRNTEVMIGLSLPFIFPWEPNSQVKKAAAERIQAEYALEKQKRLIQVDKVSLFSKAESLRKQFSKLRDSILPRAEKRMKMVHNIAPRDIETLQDHREAVEAFPELKLKMLEVRMEYENAVTSLEKLNSSKRTSNE